TNDGWFGNSSAQWQHAANVAFRSVENRVKLVRCTNNGITCWFDELGRLRDLHANESGDVYIRGFKIVEIPLSGIFRAEAMTFYRRYGDLFGWLSVLISI